MYRTDRESCVWIPKEILEEVKKIADKEERSIRVTVRRLLEDALKTEQEKENKTEFI